MILTDYFRSEYDATWDIAAQCGVKYGVIRAPEDAAFDVTDESHWNAVYDRFAAFGITPLVLEPLPNALHDHIKTGDEKRDESLDKAIRMFPILEKLGIRTICFNWMAYVGWLRTASDLPARGGACVTGFDEAAFAGTDKHISEKDLWDHYAYFLKAVIPEAEAHGIRLALHPDDPPVPRLSGVSRVMISAENIRRAVYEILPSPSLGVTMCQANFHIMGEDLDAVIRACADKIFFVHFRNTAGTRTRFRETFHDDGELDMAHLIHLYRELGIDVPIRVDHVPTLKGERTDLPGYAAAGRLFAIGYLKGLLEADENAGKEKNA